MIKKILVIIITTFTLVVNVNASSDGELVLKKNEPSEIKDCSESFNRASFALNQGLDKIIFKPVSSVYRVLPSPVKTGVSNSLNNLSNVVTIPNNILQGEFALAGINTGRFLINTTVGILGLFDVAKEMIKSGIETLTHFLDTLPNPIFNVSFDQESNRMSSIVDSDTSFIIPNVI